MSRRRRIAPGGLVYHVMNRAAGRLILFESPSDYIAFQRLLSFGQRRTTMQILAYCLMSNHWHLLLWPEDDRGLSVFMHWLTAVHARRWLLAHDAVGRGAVYQSRFKSIPVQTGEHLLTVWRYVERNPLRANLVLRAEMWPWSSLSDSRLERSTPALSKPPIELPPDWVERVNIPQTRKELEGIRQAVETGSPYGDRSWCELADPLVGWRQQGRPKRGRTPFSARPNEKGVRPLL
jgi:putative transposase